ncbi:MAG TPA: c-type cytochrome biogenesis protein CcsB [Thermodesulfovibrionales bacterium]|jgi:cytochrome c-type biogenesis protein CcsB|nr:c-type cytochrome biogenesis protein CcsB [Thermodesulfovibrionales bacterium]
MGTILFELSMTFYFAATIVSVIELLRGSKATSRLILVFAIGGFVLQTMTIIVRYAVAGHLPITSLHEASSFFAWCIVVLFFYLEYRYRLDLLGPFTMPIVFIIMLSSSILPRGIKPLSPVLQSYWLGIHTFLAFLGDAAFAMAFGIGMMYLIQEHHLKAKRLDGLFQRLPSLQILDEVNYKLITLGFPLLTLAIITGALWAESAWGSYWRWDPKEVWSLITWFIYALVLHIRLTAGWRGRKAAILSIIGFASVIFTFFGVNLLLKGLHTFI